MDLYSLLGEDPNKPEHVHARKLVDADVQLIRDLVAVRESKKLTQNDVAEAMGTSQASISRFESGHSDVHLSSIRRYAQAVGAVVEHRVSTFVPVATVPEMAPYVWEEIGAVPRMERIR